jgi:regulator of sigma E protease
MDFITALWAFFLALGPLVVVHELGHYWVARWCNVKVLRFSIGFGRVLWSRRFGPDQTEWAISLWPLGGYVKMLDQRDTDLKELSPAELSREFTNQTVGKRIAIVAAGPIANFLMAIALIALLHIHGIPDPVATLRAVPEHTAAYQAGLRGGETVLALDGKEVQSWSELRWSLLQAALNQQAKVEFQVALANGGNQVLSLNLTGLSEKDREGDINGKLGLELARPPGIISQVMEGGAAHRAGLQAGDEITMIGEHKVIDALDLVQQIQKIPGQTVVFRGKSATQQTFERQVVIEESQDKAGKRIGRIQVVVNSAPKMRILEYGLFAALGKGVEKTWQTSVLTVKMFGKMLVGEISLKNLSGPVSIAEYAGQSAQMGVIAFVSFVALISISLGVMNLLPIPVLDGGFLLYYSLEVLMGRPLPPRFAEMGQRIGFLILVIMMAIAFTNDGIRHLGKYLL